MEERRPRPVPHGPPRRVERCAVPRPCARPVLRRSFVCARSAALLFVFAGLSAA